MSDLDRREVSHCEEPRVAHFEPPPEAGSVQWFALAVKPRHDKAVARSLESKGFETFVPLFTRRRCYSTRYKDSELPLFPGYVFCRFDAGFRLPIVTTPGITQILGNGNSPSPLSETEINSLQTAVRAQLPIEPFPYLKVGQRVRIEEGVLSGVEGIVIRMKQSFRLVLSITLLQRSVLLEVDRVGISVPRIMQQPVGSSVETSIHGF
jgi:transcription antitermination factor NusG